MKKIFLFLAIVLTIMLISILSNIEFKEQNSFKTKIQKNTNVINQQIKDDSSIELNKSIQNNEDRKIENKQNQEQLEQKSEITKIKLNNIIQEGINKLQEAKQCVNDSTNIEKLTNCEPYNEKNDKNFVNKNR